MKRLFKVKLWPIVLLIASGHATVSASPRTFPAYETPKSKCLYHHLPSRCELDCYQEGRQGPCKNGQAFVRIPAELNVTLLRGEAFGRFLCTYDYERYEQEVDFDQKLTTLQNQTNYGYCIWNKPHHPCYGLPANQRFSIETQTCHPVGFREYCPRNQAFYAYEPRRPKYNQIFGECDCFPADRMWYYPDDGNCYPLHTQGPCRKGEWLAVSNPEKTIRCQRAPCPTNGSYVYWTHRHRQCYVLGDKGPCPEFTRRGVPSQEVLIRNGKGVSCGLPEDEYVAEHRCTSAVLSKLVLDSSRCPTNRPIRFTFSCGDSQYSTSAKRCIYERANCLHPYPALGCVNAECYDVGTQGPCSAGQIFLEVPKSIDKALLRGGALGKDCAYEYWSQSETGNERYGKETIPPLIDPNQQYGYCVWNDTRHPCHGRPANQRYSNETRACHTPGLQEYCGENQVFQEIPYSSLGGKYGGCDCSGSEGVWYDSKNDFCYLPQFSQTSCEDDKVHRIMKYKGDVVICKPTPCLANGQNVYWNEHCYLRFQKRPCLEWEILSISYEEVACMMVSPVLHMAPRRKPIPETKMATMETFILCSGSRYSPFLKKCVHNTAT